MIGNLPKAGRTTTGEYVGELCTNPQGFEMLQYILEEVFIEHFTNNFGGRLPLLKHPSNLEFLVATHKAGGSSSK